MRKVYFLVLLIPLLLSNCKKPPPPPPKVDTYIMLVGGLGHSQLNDVEKLTGGTQVSYTDGYKTNLVEFAAKTQYNHLILIGHSFGCNRILESSALNPKFVILIDPVAYNWEPSLESRFTCPIYVFYRNQWFGPKTAKINGPDIYVWTVQGDHNSLPHDKFVLDCIEAVLRY